MKAKETKAETPIIIRDVKLEVRDGVNTDDPDNEPGHDDDDENGIVRSFDQVSYLVFFYLFKVLVPLPNTPIFAIELSAS